MHLTHTDPILPPPSSASTTYQSFPSLTRLTGGEILLGFRQGYMTAPDVRRMVHGRNGEVFLARSADDGRSFATPALLVPTCEGYNEHDALVTSIPAGAAGGDDVVCLTRSHGPSVFSCFAALSKDGGKIFGQRIPLRLFEGYGASFGHLVPSLRVRELLFSWYGHERCAVGALTLENDGVLTARVRGVIREGRRSALQKKDEDYWLNETSLVRLADGRLLAVIRQQPCVDGLFVAWSDSDGETWSEPAPCGLFGEAPSVLRLRDGHIAVIYRYFPDSEDMIRNCALAVAISADHGATWGEPLIIRRYDGGRYHGGYGDLLQSLDGRELLAAYYVCDAGGLPRLELARITL